MHRAARGTGVVLALFMGAHVGCVGSHGVRWAEARAPGIRVNQLGYLPHGPKWAVVRSDATQPLTVQLARDQQILWTGQSIPRGLDEASGDPVHWVDFSAYRKPQTQVVLRTASTSSFSFDLRDDLYDQLPVDALKYFYHN
ncbi:MAG TPA: cellulase N-terminal Ig-like domain-containing protein, partial [Polyangiaceae bacterium]|nr:cellulase N-terminal Ig-like domain-containing protein [Polyangiaceae bacterium]